MHTFSTASVLSLAVLLHCFSAVAGLCTEGEVFSNSPVPFGEAVELDVCVHSSEEFTVLWEFDFGDTMLTQGVSEVHYTYPYPGVYYPRATVRKGPKGHQDVVFKTLTTRVEVYDCTSAAARPSFHFEEDEAHQRSSDADMVLFTACVDDPHASGVMYSWDFRDGSSIESGLMVLHRFSALSSAQAVTLTITAPTFDPIVLTGNADICSTLAAINDSPTRLGSETRLTACMDSPSRVVTWTLGDGTEMRGADVSHRYREAGVYYATAHIRDDDAFLPPEITRVVVYDCPANSGEFVNVQPLGDGRVQLTACVTGAVGGMAFFWDFGDGSSVQQGLVVEHAFPPGTHTVRVEVSGPGGEKTLSGTVTSSGVAPGIPPSPPRPGPAAPPAVGGGDLPEDGNSADTLQDGRGDGDSDDSGDGGGGGGGFFSRVGWMMVVLWGVGAVVLVGLVLFGIVAWVRRRRRMREFRTVPADYVLMNQQEVL